MERYGSREMERAVRTSGADLARGGAGATAASGQVSPDSAEERVREERGLGDAIVAVTESQSTEELLDRLVESAVAATGAEGAVVERIRPETNELEVVAAAGTPEVELGGRIPFSGSFTAEAIDAGRPMVISVDRSAGRPTHLPPECAGLIVPLVDAGIAIGALLLMRCSGDRRFRPEEVERARTFAGLASLAFHKLHVLEESKRGRAELTRVTESRARLMRGFSHDLKNPLGAAYGHLELLETGVHGKMDDAARESVTRARNAIRTALRLIDDLLELARAEAGHVEVRRAPIDLRLAVREIAEEYRASAAAKGMRVEVRMPPEFPIVESDAHRIRQILGNLIGNALKHAAREGGRVTIALGTRRAAEPPREWATIDVADDGPGIPPEQIPQIFDEFRRADGGSGNGAGIGLAISQRIAHALGGRITVESEVGAGSVFTLWLPLESP